MVSTILGMIILSTVTISMLLAISMGTRAIKSSANNPLSSQEKQMIKNAGYSEREIEVIQIDINNLYKKASKNEK